MDNLDIKIIVQPIKSLYLCLPPFSLCGFQRLTDWDESLTILSYTMACPACIKKGICVNLRFTTQIYYTNMD